MNEHNHFTLIAVKQNPIKKQAQAAFKGGQEMILLQE